MKKNNYVLLLLFVAAASILSSCNKQSRIEKSLWKNGGEWNIETLQSIQVSSIQADNFDELFFQCGSFSFNEDGSGTYTYTVGGDVESGDMSYSNTESQLTFIINNQTRVFEILEWEKDEMVLSITENFSNNISSGQYTEVLTIKKQ